MKYDKYMEWWLNNNIDIEIINDYIYLMSEGVNKWMSINVSWNI